METAKDEPVTPAGRLFLRPEMNQIISCAIGYKHPIDIEAFKVELSKCILLKHPRFCSLLVVDKHGREFWRKTEINFEDHIIIHEDKPSSDINSEEEIEEKINSFLADFTVSCPLSIDKPLWEVHIFSELKCTILRIHHAFGDGISLMSLFLASCKRSDGSANDGEISIENRRSSRTKGLWDIFKMIWFTIICVIGFVGRSLWIRDIKTIISGAEGVELWPRKLATAKFSLGDMKIVKKAIPNATINDVLFGVISFGFSKYLDNRSSHEELQITGLAMVNLRKQPGVQELSKLMNDNSIGVQWGNQFGMVLLPIYCNINYANLLNYVRRAKVMIDQKKQYLEAYFSYNIGSLVMTLLGPKVACMLNYRIVCNTTFTISNIVGPREELTFAGNPITYIRPTSSSLPHAVTMHMVSYREMADMQIQVAKDIIPNPEFLAKCFEDALVEMKVVARNIIF